MRNFSRCNRPVLTIFLLVQDTNKSLEMLLLEKNRGKVIFYTNTGHLEPKEHLF